MVHHQADAPDDPVGSCAYFSRLIGSDPDLVLHGGGNSSVKAPWSDITGRIREAIFVKGSGWDMGSLEVDGLTALSLSRLRELLELDELSDVDMMREVGDDTNQTTLVEHRLGHQDVWEVRTGDGSVVDHNHSAGFQGAGG